jgi:hypothetical protein
MVKSTFDTYYQQIYGSLPDEDDAGTLDRKTGKIYLRAVNKWLQVYLERAVHEAIHLFTCLVKGDKTNFYLNYGAGITEGFTQFVTEEILKSQKIEIVGLNAVADDYFTCSKRIHAHLERIKKFGDFKRLSQFADTRKKADEKREAYEKLTEFLESVRASMSN